MDKKFYITAPIFYANAKLHMGHAYSLVLSDILARYHRTIGEKTFFVSGADEHGDKIVRAAQKEGLGPQVFVNIKFDEFKELSGKLGISNDFFVRTSDKECHWPGAQKLWRALLEAGDVYKDAYKGLYCVGCEAFITEHELVDGKCPHHDTVPESISEENYFFKLSKYALEIRQLINERKLKITPHSKANEMIALIDEGLSDVSISRPEKEIPWGVPVPGDSSHFMYVWCDALSSYLSALGYGGEDDTNFREFWPANVQVIGKDIMRFHTLLWPALLLSAKLPLPQEIFVHGFITSGGKKMSKSIGNVLDPYEFINEYGLDALRYYLAREVVPTEDGDLTHERFKEIYNANLANGIGNLVSRTLKMAEQYFGGNIAGQRESVPPLRTRAVFETSETEIGGFNIPFIIQNNILPRYHTHMQGNEINKAADVVWELVSHLDHFITDYEPFKLIKTDKEMTGKVLWGVIEGILQITDMLIPLMPDTAQKIRELIKTEEKDGETTFITKTPAEPLFGRK
ncbi:MAG: methionine--tRNA ligase [Candidatus Yonathbacteria bacterium]|nr:methionine--tRNA ligase [Candidatus Yonathbacteria bacterium]